MRRLVAERLLGGFAAGILTQPEREILFRAALEHQEIFDALMDEEALRELLADPVVRGRLLALLAEPAQLRPLWQRPAVLGTAASLLLLVTTSLVMLRREGPSVLTSESLGPRKEVENTTVVPPQPSSSKPAAAPKLKGAKRAAQPAPPPEPEFRQAEAKALPGLDAAPGPSLGAGLAAKKAEVPAAAEVSEQAAPERQDRDELAKHRAVASTAVRDAASPPLLERLSAGRFRLTVPKAEGEHLYVLKRSKGRVELLQASDVSNPLAVYELELGAQDALDVYRLRRPEGDPTSLPASGEVQGEWRRVFPH